MILNNQIWKQTLNPALTLVATSPVWLCAIERAVKEIERAAYWSFTGGVLKIKSTTRGKLYVIDDAHTCEATASGHQACQPQAARRLMLRYSERLAAAELECKTVTVRRWSANEGAATVEGKPLYVKAAEPSRFATHPNVSHELSSTNYSD